VTAHKAGMTPVDRREGFLPPDDGGRDRGRDGAEVSNHPFNVWPNMAVALNEDLRWLVENQAAIVKAHGARPMPKARPVKVWPDGKVRIEWVETFESAAAAREHWEGMLRK